LRTVANRPGQRFSTIIDGEEDDRVVSPRSSSSLSSNVLT
jgi:hypothetical protein